MLEPKRLQYPADILNPQCPSRQALEILANKWVMFIIMHLAKGTLRNGQLKRSVGDVSQKVLTETLRRLEDSGIVQRTVYAEVPPKVEYSLTELGHTLVEPIMVLGKWSEEHCEEVFACQAAALEEKEKAEAS